MVRLSRVGIIYLSLLLFGGALVARAAQVQLWQRALWAERAERQHFKAAKVPAPRGAILDAAGVYLAQSRELVRLEVAPREVRDRAALGRALTELGVERSWVQRATDARRKWVTLPGKYLPVDAAPVIAIRGVYSEPVIERVYPRSEGTRRIVGRVGGDGAAVDGIELMLDTLLQGVAGTTTVMREASGRAVGWGGGAPTGTLARMGHSVTLTVNYELQSIADRALADAVSRMGASGGDIVILDPHEGSILALASKRSDPRSTAATALTEPFEPGSTLKPFIAAALIERGLARPDDVVETNNGTYETHGRTITDIHREARMSLADVIRWSSNVGIVKFAERLRPAHQYELLRDLGFGAPTGVPYPSEASGTLRMPQTWTTMSPASLAMGYEIAVTPIQLAVAYASIANGGELIEPSLVREIRDADGRVRYRHTKRVARRVMSPEVARSIRAMLVDVVEHGTAVQADLSTFAVAGKSGTARRTRNGRYSAGHYTATFVGLFPANEPQYVILVKLDDPSGAYYGGATAAPVTKIVLEAAIAARDAALDRGALASRPARGATPVVAVRDSIERPEREDTGAVSSIPYVFALDAPASPAAPRGAARPVPDVRGLPLRDAVRMLHDSGFNVRLGRGPDGETRPLPGTLARPGDTVRLLRAR